MSPSCAARLLLFASAGTTLLAGAAPARAQAPEAPPKVAVVVAGDPDGPLREAAAAVDARLGEDGHLLVPGDAGVRRALRGEPAPSEDDGLERLRGERRRLGWDERTDAEVLLRLGRMTGAQLLLVVRRRQEAVVLEAFDVGAGAFYEDALDLGTATPEAIDAYVQSRARAAQRRAQAPTPVPAPAVAAEAASAPTPAAAPAAEAAPEAALAPDATPPARRFMRRNWPYFVAGVLLVGAVTAVAVTRHNDSSPPPVLRFVSGAND